MVGVGCLSLGGSPALRAAVHAKWGRTAQWEERCCGQAVKLLSCCYTWLLTIAEGCLQTGLSARGATTRGQQLEYCVNIEAFMPNAQLLLLCELLSHGTKHQPWGAKPVHLLL